MLTFVTSRHLNLKTIFMITQKTAQERIDYAEKYGKEAAAEHFNIGVDAIDRYYRLINQITEQQSPKYLDNNELKDSSSENEKTVSGEAKDLDDLLKKLKVDLSIWEVKEWRVRSTSWDVSAKERDQDLTWTKEKGKDGFPIQVMEGYAKRGPWETKENQSFKIEVKLVRRISQGIEDILERTKESMREYVSPVHQFKYPKQKSFAAVINLFDAHIDALSIKTYSGVDSNIEENVKAFEDGFDELLAGIATFNPEIIYFPVGSDFFNTNALGLPTTKKGTGVQVSVEPEISFPMGFHALRRCIDKASKYCTVTVPVIRGNHDDDKTFYLGFVLGIAYEKNANVEIDDRRLSRKYYQYGNSLLGFTHGSFEKRTINDFPLRMFMENKDTWANVEHGDMFMGDIHHKQEYKFLRVKDFPGITMRFLRSIAVIDQYHNDRGYLGIPSTAESFIYSFDKGLRSNWFVNIH